MTDTQTPRKLQNRVPCWKCNASLTVEQITAKGEPGGLAHVVNCPKCGYQDELWRAKNKAEVIVCQKTEGYKIEAVPGEPGRLIVSRMGKDGWVGYPVVIDSRKVVQSCGCEGHSHADYCKHGDRVYFKTPYLWDAWKAEWRKAAA